MSFAARGAKTSLMFTNQGKRKRETKVIIESLCRWQHGNHSLKYNRYYYIWKILCGGPLYKVSLNIESINLYFVKLKKQRR